MMTNDDIIEMGFEPIGHFTIMDCHLYDLGRYRQLSIGSVGTPNEMMFITQSDPDDHKKITDIICLHNYDYDGYLTHDKLTQYLELLDANYYY